jgi:hypothetical protein
MRKIMRRRICVAFAIIITVAIGLASRKYGWLFPSALSKQPGDALWAMAVYWVIGFVFLSASIPRIASCALLISYADEFSQIYQAPWLNQIRATSIGHLILGSFFSWFDIVAYTIGIGLCAAIEAILLREKIREKTATGSHEFHRSKRSNDGSVKFVELWNPWRWLSHLVLFAHNLSRAAVPGGTPIFWRNNLFQPI